MWLWITITFIKYLYNDFVICKANGNTLRGFARPYLAGCRAVLSDKMLRNVLQETTGRRSYHRQYCII